MRLVHVLHLWEANAQSGSLKDVHSREGLCPPFSISAVSGRPRIARCAGMDLDGWILCAMAFGSRVIDAEVYDERQT
jgi:hypothetical protein